MLLLIKIVILCTFAICCFANLPKYELARGRTGDIIEGNFFFAYQYCKKIGRKLATPNTDAKNEELKKYLKKKALENTWTSGNDLGEEGTFLWMMDGSDVTYLDWHPNNPSNSDNGENCIEMRKEHADWHWNDNDCTRKFPVICEKAELPQAIKC